MRKGRPKKDRPRHPGGQLVREDAGITGTQLQRLRALGTNPLIETQIGRLLFLGELTETEAAAAFRIAEIYGRYDRAVGRRRSLASPSYEVGRGRDPGLMESDSARARSQSAARAFGALQAEMALCPRGVRSPLEELCVEDRACPPGWLPAVRIAFDMLALALGIRRRRRNPHNSGADHNIGGLNRGGITHQSGHKGPSPDRGIRPDGAAQNPDREAFIETLTRLGYVAPEDAAGVYGHYRALVERGRFRRDKERK